MNNVYITKKDEYGNITLRLFTDWRAWAIGIEVPRIPNCDDPLGQWCVFKLDFLCFHLMYRWRTL